MPSWSSRLFFSFSRHVFCFTVRRLCKVPCALYKPLLSLFCLYFCSSYFMATHSISAILLTCVKTILEKQIHQAIETMLLCFIFLFLNFSSELTFVCCIRSVCKWLVSGGEFWSKTKNRKCSHWRCRARSSWSGFDIRKKDNASRLSSFWCAFTCTGKEVVLFWPWHL